MTESGIDFSLRIYWTKIAAEQKWTLAHIRELRHNILPVTERADFQKNLIERRYTVEKLDKHAHSGASLLALLEVLDALEAHEGDD